jgi:hypothetical protein
MLQNLKKNRLLIPKDLFKYKLEKFNLDLLPELKAPLGFLSALNRK